MMLKTALITALTVLSAAAPALSQELKDTSYQTVHDGAPGKFSIKAGFAKITFGKGQCFGEPKGRLELITNGHYRMHDKDCTVDFEHTGGDLWDITGQNCAALFSPRCDINGKIVSEDFGVNRNELDAAFNGFSIKDRKMLQAQLRDIGFYDKKIDGKTGPSTRQAIEDSAAYALAGGENLKLESAADATRYLSSLITPSEIDEHVIFGDWDCEGSEFSFKPDGYRTAPGTDPLPYESIEKISDDMYGITFVDGYRLGIIGMTDVSMTWSSPDGGEIIACERKAE
jgi:hypothetical protein